MQVRENDAQLLYGLFQSICSWALEKGYNDISGMKNLLKLAMVDVCHQRYPDKSPISAQMAIVTDLGISLRNVQKTLKTLGELKNFADGFVRIRQIQAEIVLILTKQPQTFDEILPEVSYLIHAPYDLQKRTLRTILQDMEQKNIISKETANGRTIYKTNEPHVNLFDPTDLPARVSALLLQIDAFNHTISTPFLRVFSMSHDQAKGLQTAVNEFLRGTGNAYEHECREENSVTKPFDLYLGSAPTSRLNHPLSVADAILECISARFTEVNSPSLLRIHSYHLTPTTANTVFEEVRDFIEREGKSVSQSMNTIDITPFSFYFGLADQQSRSPAEEI